MNTPIEYPHALPAEPDGTRWHALVAVNPSMGYLVYAVSEKLCNEIAANEVERLKGLK